MAAIVRSLPDGFGNGEGFGGFGPLGEDAIGEEVDSRGHSTNAFILLAASGDDTGNVSAMAETVVSSLSRLLAACGVRLAGEDEVFVLLDSRVDDSHADARSVGVGAVPIEEAAAIREKEFKRE